MANTQTAFGFRHIGFLPGYAPDYQLSTRQIQSSYATAILNGDPVIHSAASGYIAVASNATTTALEGIFQGCTYVPSGGGAPVWSPWFPGSTKTDATAYVLNAPGALLMAATILTAVSSACVGANVAFTGSGLATSLTGAGLSNVVIDPLSTATGTANSVFPFRVVDLYSTRGIGNGSDNTTNYNWAILTFNNQGFRNASGVV